MVRYVRINTDIQTYRPTDTTHILRVYLGVAQANPSKVGGCPVHFTWNV